MANDEQLKILKQGVEGWNKWRKENEDIVVDLRRAELVEANLCSADLSNANLSNANLTKASFNYASLQEADLSEADLSRVNLNYSYLSGVNLSKTKLSNAQLDSVDLSDVDLSGADLSNAILTNTRLRRANLYGANLNYADLSGADLSNAKLVEADLSNALLNNARLRRANLSNADLSNADLVDANLIGVKLFQTNFTESNLGVTILGQIDLASSIGLEAINVKLPCVLDFQTIQTIPFKIRNTVLKKFGYNDTYTEYISDLFDQNTIKMFPIFLSHSWADKEFARKLYEALIDKGVQVWFDEKKMKMGDDIYKRIDKGIKDYDKMLLVCSEASLKESWWVDREISRILEKERKYKKEKGKDLDLLIPITVDNFVFEWEGAKSMEVKDKIIGDFTDWKNPDKFEEKLNELIRALNPVDIDIPPISFL